MTRILDGVGRAGSGGGLPPNEGRLGRATRRQAAAKLSDDPRLPPDVAL